MSIPTLPLAAVAAALSLPANAQVLSSPDVAGSMGLERLDRVELLLGGLPGLQATASFEHEGQEHFLDLLPVSVRGENFRLVEHRADDSYVEMGADAPVTYRGEISTMPGAGVAASWLEDGLHARILLPDGTSLWLEPLVGHDAAADWNDYAFYADADVADRGHECGVDQSIRAGSPLVAPGTLSGGDVAFGSAFTVAELGIDADFEYFSDYGSSAATQNKIESVINTMNLQYEGDVGITHVISTLIIRTSSNDPYSSTSPSTLLDQFLSHWNTAQAGQPRDVAHLFTGKNLSGSVIGIAYLNAVCSTFAYGLVESDCCGSFANTTDLSAHELGHNWGADHCNCSGYTMNSFLTGANQFHPNFTVPDIVNFANSVNCLDTGPGGGGNCDNSSFGVGVAAANIGTLDSNDDAQLGSTWTATYSGFNGNSTGLFIAAGQQASIPFGNGIILIQYNNPTASVPIVTNNGSGSVDVPVPNTPGIAGLTAYGQVGILDGSFSAGYALSNGLAITFCN